MPPKAGQMPLLRSSDLLHKKRKKKFAPMAPDILRQTLIFFAFPETFQLTPRASVLPSYYFGDTSALNLYLSYEFSSLLDRVPSAKWPVLGSFILTASTSGVTRPL